MLLFLQREGVDIAVVPFPADALPANRSGRLTERQRHNLGNRERSRQSSTRSFALIPLAIAAIILFVPGLHASALVHYGVPFVCIVLAIVLVFWASAGSDRMARDLREGRVVSLEGEVNKRTFTTATTSAGKRDYLFDIGGKSFTVFHDTYDAVSPGSKVRVYYLPRSNYVVNLERIQDVSVAEVVNSPDIFATPGETSSPDTLSTLGTDPFSQDPLARIDTPDTAQATIDLIEERFNQHVDSSTETVLRAPSLVGAIVGSWRNAMVAVTFHLDGTTEAELMDGRKRSGNWSVNTNGRLHFELMGQDAAADVQVAGNQLTISVNGEGLTFDRVAD